MCEKIDALIVSYKKTTQKSDHNHHMEFEHVYA